MNLQDVERVLFVSLTLLRIQEGILAMKSLSLLIKPTSSRCNMKCSYCFYADEAESRTKADRGMMSYETMQTLICSALEAVDRNGEIQFAFQGGEPTLAGLSWFEKFVVLVRENNTKNIHIRYSIQTNGLVLTQEWIDFLSREQFLVGISLDGDPFIHDRLRLDAAGKGTWNRVCQNIALLQQNGIGINILCVVTKYGAKNPEKVYRSLKETGAQYLQFIPCLDPLKGKRGTFSWSLSPEKYGHFLCGLFDVWYQDLKEEKDLVDIRLFEDYLYLDLGMTSGTCSVDGSCGSYIVVEADGSLYPCDFYCLDEWEMGNLGDNSLDQVLSSAQEQEFLAKRKNRPMECSHCDWEDLCHGGCSRDWEITDQGTHNYFCSSFKQFFSYAGQRLDEIADEILQDYGNPDNVKR